MSFPLEPITLGIGTLVGAWKDITMSRIDVMRQSLLSKQEDNKDTQNAREASKGNKELQFTKRLLAILMVTTLCLLMLGLRIPGFEYVTTHIGYTELVPKFLWFGEKEAVRWIAVEGPALTPAFSNMVSFIIGFYFGSGGTRRAR